ncbi:AAA family ATPase, partial [Methylobacillus flagellatus]|uniref:ATP-binding protein n=1 Tax=Methylobacillus flagellatus TaxID=405 RepID=UPI002853B428
GVGKTLTAEVYAELIERPLYAIHSGNLGTAPEQINKNLQKIFMQARRWHCVLLLDEADIFVMQRASNIEQNAIVAEFLRTLEYFDGLLFMTTNRPDDIDDAIISRCAAIIDYAVPGPEDSAAIWRVMAAQYQARMDEALIAELVASFPGIAPRDIKMLLRLALRLAKKRDVPLSMEIFRQCAMFRAVRAASH